MERDWISPQERYFSETNGQFGRWKNAKTERGERDYARVVVVRGKALVGTALGIVARMSWELIPDFALQIRRK